MKKGQDTPIPEEISKISSTLEMAGYKVFLVGGCVRDILSGRKPKDWDFTTNAKPDQIQGLFTKTVYENTYGTVAVINEETSDSTLRNVEITPFRTESEYTDKRHPDSVKFSDKIENDLSRRDFTVNAIAASITNSGAIKDVVDLYGGFQDIKDKVIRTVGKPEDRFHEDALRMMRAVRLSVQLGFTIVPETLNAIRQYSNTIKDIANERVRDEFEKIIMSDQPMKGLVLLHETGILAQILPELEASVGVTQNKAHIYDVWEHLIRSLQHAADKNLGLEIRLSALFHDIAKPKTKAFSRETNQTTFYNHELVGSRETRKILERLRFSRATIEKVTSLVRWHMFFSDTEQVTMSAVRRMIVNVGRENIWDLLEVRTCDRIGMGRPVENPVRLRKYRVMIEQALTQPVSVSMLKIDGQRIMTIANITPGPKIGAVLHALLQEVLEDPEKNTSEYLEKRALELLQLSDKELNELGEGGKQRKDIEQKKKVEEIKKKHNIS
jgi:poly(A) polymerase/tRNA nucleotidyltransferase (CCA-adding enzyme)